MTIFASGGMRAAILSAMAAVAVTLFDPHPIAQAEEPDMLIRISEIEIFPEHLQEYQRILREESAASVRLEPGVVSIFPASQQDNPTQIRILEIYASRAAYDAHIQSDHFQTYKTSTLKMVKSLRLIDMSAVDAGTMPLIFKKMSDRP